MPLRKIDITPVTRGVKSLKQAKRDNLIRKESKSSRGLCPPLSLKWFSELRRRLLVWYGSQARELPWRGSGDPYAIWVSEIMLQQTTVATVRPAFTRFLKTFPTVAALAAAEEQAVLRQWEGLGYYRRARQLHAAARVIAAEHDGKFPRDPAQILALPGIGRYTAGAIASIAFAARTPILEANTLRLWARLLGEEGDLTRKPMQDRLWRAAEAVLPHGAGSGELNQALMDLGSQICLPREPLCLLCPAASLCAARALGKVDSIPLAAKKTNWTARHEAAALLTRGLLSRGQEILVVQYATGERWAGLWDVPRVTLTVGEPIPPESELTGLHSQLVTELTSLIELSWEIVGLRRRFKHVVTRYKITLDLFAARCSTMPPGKFRFDQKRLIAARWVKQSELANLPLSTTGRMIVEQFLREEVQS